MRPPAPTNDAAWLIEDAGFALAREHEVESVFAIGNGLLGVRGGLAEGSSLSDPATFVAGVFDVEPTWNSIPGLMVLADWTDLRVAVQGCPLSLEVGEMLEHRRILDLKQGVLWREWRHRDDNGRITHLRFVRFASQANRRVAAQRAIVVADNYTGRVRIECRTGLAPVRLRRWDAVPSKPRPSLRLLAPPNGKGPIAEFAQQATTGATVTFATATMVCDGKGDHVRSERKESADSLVEAWECDARVGEPIVIDRVVSVDRSPSGAHAANGAARELTTVLRRGLDRAFADHVAAWSARWQQSDVEVEGDADAQRALRFAIYHLIATVNPDDPRVSVGARALTGEAYRGHVFWDTETYLLPFYTYTYPAAARSLLEYRHVTLPGARRKAQALGYRGALYAWESTDTGDETTPKSAITPNGEVVRILTGEQEHHISADVAYAVWQYWDVTGDDAFFVGYGAEIVLETARFWASRGTIEDDGCYHIRCVIGPDEYHESIDDNAYTNVMARWNLVRGADTAALLETRWPEAWKTLSSALQLAPEEPTRWRTLATAMKTGFDRRTSVFEQFEGYKELEDLSLASFEPRNAPMDIILQRERLQQSKIVKQADVVALSALLWDDYPREVHEANFRYYEPRTAHGSSLSPALHSMIAARLGDDVLFDRYFRQAAQIDLGNNMGNAAGGVHIAALGGLWQAAVLGVGGLRPRPDGLAFDPRIPRMWAAVRFAVQWRQRTLRVALDRATRTIEVRLDATAPMVVTLDGGQSLEVTPGATWRASEHAIGEWSPWERVEAPNTKGTGPFSAAGGTP